MRFQAGIMVTVGVLLTQASPLNPQGTPPANAQRPEEPSYPLGCYKTAEDRTLLSKDQAMRLCMGATNTSPVDCFNEADRRLSASDDYNITLCQCARSTEPVECFERSQNETDLSEQRSLQMCNARALWHLAADCRPI